MTYQTKCHYEILSVPRDADAATIKKAHRRLALQHHPDKNVNKSEEEQHASAAEFKLIQAAYECLSDPVERRWYDEHREMILRGGVAAGGGGDDGSFLFDVMNFQFAGCYDGYGDDENSFYGVYNMVFTGIFEGEKNGFVSEGGIDFTQMSNYHLAEVTLGSSRSEWSEVSSFYSAWESFTSCLSFAWEDVYHLDDLREAPNRRIRRLMEDDNKKKRKVAKKERVDEVCALVRFVKRRDPRVTKQKEMTAQEQHKKEAAKKKEAAIRKEEVAAAKEKWLAQAEQNMREQEAADLDAGRIRLADLDSDEDYSGKRGRNKKKGKRNKGKKNRQVYSSDEEFDCEQAGGVADSSTDSVNGQQDNDNNDNDVSALDATTPEAISGQTQNNNTLEPDTVSSENECSSEEESEPDSWRCECCRKDFKSEKQFDNHIKSKKHKETLKKFEKKVQKEAVDSMMQDLG